MSRKKQLSDFDRTNASDRTPGSRIAGFYKLELEERLKHLVDTGVLNPEEADGLRARREVDTAEIIIENAIGTIELPLGLGLNFLIDGEEYLIPMATEEPSVIAAVSHAAKTVRKSGGFETAIESSDIIGQIQVTDVPDLEQASEAILSQKEKFLEDMNQKHPRLVDRGGGAKDLEVRTVGDGDDHEMLVIQLRVDPCDAMGANIVNSMAESIAPDIEELTGGKVLLRILSNLGDQSLAFARCQIPFEELSRKNYSGESIARDIESASQFAEADPYRAATHNKGIMNGVDAVVLALGNDWRAVEASAHAYVGTNQEYGPLATWRTRDGMLVGEICLPLQVGTVGGTMHNRESTHIAHRILDVEGAEELMSVLAAVGLGQNLSALRALVTDGIQKGHMKLHAKNVAAMTEATDKERTELTERLIEEGIIKVEKAREILDFMRTKNNGE